jgi:serine protease inhibitor ecotin
VSFDVPVWYSLAGNYGGEHDPDAPPAVRIRGTTYSYVDVDNVTDQLVSLMEAWPEIDRHLKENQFATVFFSAMEYIAEIKQWQIILYASFEREGEGLMFKIWHAEQNWNYNPFRGRDTRGI